jgi:tol-pal system protein YbgF
MRHAVRFGRRAVVVRGRARYGFRPRVRGRVYIWGCVLVAVAGCGVPQRTTTNLERQQQSLQQEVVALRAKVADLEGKVAVLTKRVGSVANPKAAARAANDPNDSRAGAIGRDQGEETRTAIASPAGAPATTRGSTPTPSAAPELDVDALRRESARQLPARYAQALALVRDSQYEDAIQAMRDFVRAHHGSPFVGGAHYWIGESHMQLGQFYLAILALTEVQQRWARSEWAPAAGFATGIAFLQLGNVSEARRAFEKVAADYPAAPEAAKATARLQALAARTP